MNERCRFSVAACVALVLCAQGCNDSNRSNDRVNERSASLSNSDTNGVAIAQKIGVALPSSITFDYARYMSGKDDAAQLIFSLPASEWEKISSSPPFAGATFGPDARFHLGPDDGAWLPSKEKNLLVAQVPYRAGKQSLNIGVVKLDPTHVKIYLLWYQL